MLINQTFEIDSCDDVELNIKRTSKLEYRISYHCFCHRRSNVEKYSAYKFFQEEDIENIKNLLNQFHFSYGEINNDNALFLANSLVKHVENLKMQNKLDHNFKLNFTSTIVPVRKLAERTQKSLSEIEANTNLLVQSINDMAESIKEQTAGILKSMIGSSN